MGKIFLLFVLGVGLAATNSEGSSSGQGGHPSAYYGGGYNNYDASWSSEVGSVKSDPPNPATQAREEENPLPPGWAEYIDQGSGQPYYHNANDGTTTWDRPVADYAEQSFEEETSEMNVTEADPIDYSRENGSSGASGQDTMDQAQSDNEAADDSHGTPYGYPGQQLPEEQATRTPEGSVLTNYRVDERNGAPMQTDERSPNRNQQQPSMPPAWGVPNQQSQPQVQSWGSGNQGAPRQDEGAPVRTGAGGPPAGYEAPRQPVASQGPQTNANAGTPDHSRQQIQGDEPMHRSPESYRGQQGLSPDGKNQQGPPTGPAQITSPPRQDQQTGPPPRSATPGPEKPIFQASRPGDFENKPLERPPVSQSRGPPPQQFGRAQQTPPSGQFGSAHQHPPAGGQRIPERPFGVSPQDPRQEQNPAQSPPGHYNAPPRGDGPQGQFNAPPRGDGPQGQYNRPQGQYNAPPHDGLPGQYKAPPRTGPMDNQRPPPGGPNTRSPYPPSLQNPQNQHGPPGSQRPPQQQQNPPYGQYQQYGAYGQQPPQRTHQLVSEETSTAVRGAIGSAWQGIVGFGNRTKEAVETAKSSVVNTAKEATQTISTKSTGWWGQARNTLGSLFEPGEGDGSQSPYSLAGDQSNQQPPPGGPGNMQAPGMYPGHQGRYPYPQQQQAPNAYNNPPGYPPRYPPQGQGPPSYPGTHQGQPPQGGQGRPNQTGPYPPGFRPPQPRGDLPYPHDRSPPQGPGGQRQQPPPQRQGPPPQTQWGAPGTYPPTQPNWQQQQLQGGRGPPPNSPGKVGKEASEPWNHPGLGPDF